MKQFYRNPLPNGVAELVRKVPLSRFGKVTVNKTAVSNAVSQNESEEIEHFEHTLLQFADDGFLGSQSFHLARLVQPVHLQRLSVPRHLSRRGAHAVLALVIRARVE